MIEDFRAFQATRVDMTKQAYLKVYNQPEDAIGDDCSKVSVFADGFHIEHLHSGECRLILGNQEYTDPQLSTLINKLWDDFAKDELNAGHWHARIRELQLQYNLKPVSGDELQIYGILAMPDEHILEYIDLIRKIKGDDK